MVAFFMVAGWKDVQDYPRLKMMLKFEIPKLKGEVCL